MGLRDTLSVFQSTKCACIMEIAAARVDGIDHLSPCPRLSPYLFEAGGVPVAVYFKGKHDNQLYLYKGLPVDECSTGRDNNDTQI